MSMALIMAGGRSERMRRSLGEVGKPLVRVLGAPLIERNLMALLRAGLAEIAVAAPAAGDRELDAWIGGRGAALAAAAGATLTAIRETTPRGNIGVAGDFAGRTEELLVVFADNLTTLDLRAVLDAHAASRADLTLAVHEERFVMPYGAVEVRGGRVTAYREKPVSRHRVCSAVTVLGARSLAVLQAQAPAPQGLSDLFRQAADRRLVVRAHEHQANWIDVNDAAAVERAEAMLEGSREAFDCWAREPLQRRLMVEFGAGGPAVRHVDAPFAADGWRDLGAFDDVDGAGRAVRYTVLSGRRAAGPASDGWLEGAALTEALGRDGALRRALAIAGAGT